MSKVLDNYEGCELSAIKQLIGRNIFIRLLTGLNIRGRLNEVTDKVLTVITDVEGEDKVVVVVFDYIVTVEEAH